MKNVFNLSVPHQYGIEVLQEKKGRFTVKYGKLVRKGLTYTEACHTFGEYVFHALSCNGQIDD